jgi:hypothetical protein
MNGDKYRDLVEDVREIGSVGSMSIPIPLDL